MSHPSISQSIYPQTFPAIAKLVQNIGKNFSTFDLEATTFGGPTFGITECASVTVDASGLCVTRQGLVNPKNPISYHAVQKNGITWDMVRGKPDWGTAWGPEMNRLCSQSVTGGWSSKTFDVPRTRGENRRYQLPEPDFSEHIDVYNVASRVRGDRKGDLTETARALGVTWPGRAHRALADSLVTMLVLETLIEAHGLDVVWNKPKAPKTVKSSTSIATSELLSCVLAEGYHPAVLAKHFNISVESVERKASDILAAGNVDAQLFACEETQAWLVEALRPAIVSCWSGPKKHLKPLLEHLKRNPRADERLTYVQLRVALANNSERAL